MARRLASGSIPHRGGTLDGMSMSRGVNPTSPLKLEYPQSLAVYDDYAAAQKAVDFLSDEKFPVEHCMIVGTDLKRIERITGRLTTGQGRARAACSPASGSASSSA